MSKFLILRYFNDLFLYLNCGGSSSRSSRRCLEDVGLLIVQLNIVLLSNLSLGHCLCDWVANEIYYNFLILEFNVQRQLEKCCST